VLGSDSLIFVPSTSGAGITALTGDVTATGPGSAMATIATSGVVAGTYQGLTVNAKGLVTSASDQGYATVAYVDGHMWGYSALPAEVQQLPIPFIWPGQPSAGGLVNMPMVMAVTIPSGLAGTKVFDTTQATANASFALNKISGGTTTSLGTVVITPASRTSANLAGTGGSLAIGDVLQMAAPGSPDATLADLGITILAARV